MEASRHQLVINWAFGGGLSDYPPRADPGVRLSAPGLQPKVGRDRGLGLGRRIEADPQVGSFDPRRIRHSIRGVCWCPPGRFRITVSAPICGRPYSRPRGRPPRRRVGFASEAAASSGNATDPVRRARALPGDHTNCQGGALTAGSRGRSCHDFKQNNSDTAPGTFRRRSSRRGASLRTLMLLRLDSRRFGAPNTAARAQEAARGRQIHDKQIS
jgi:hypothetical protein